MEITYEVMLGRLKETISRGNDVENKVMRNLKQQNCVHKKLSRMPGYYDTHLHCSISSSQRRFNMC
jgi:hypothetical protein